MAYADLAKVQGLIAKFVIGPSSTPNIDQANEIIDSIGREIDVALNGSGVTTPITVPTYFVSYLADLNAWGAAADILKSMLSGARDGDNPAYQFWLDKYRQAMTGIRDKSGLPQEILVESGTLYVAPSSFLTNNVDQPLQYGNAQSPMFSVGKEF